MDLYGQTDKSIPQKVTMHLIEIALLVLSGWILFGSGGRWCETHLHITNATGGEIRRILIFGFNVITFLRIGYTMFFLLKRKIPWEESISVPLAFAVYYVGFSLFVLPVSKGPDGWVWFAVVLFLLGCVLNSGSEILRDRWKRKPENIGKLYIGGFFKYSRHINYFGDILWVTAYAVVTGNVWSGIIPVLLFFFFAFFNAPALDKHLRKKYGEAYDVWAARTKMLIPFVY